jgi:predicted DNA-binding antitoxin AbrB/MazE fold protein
MKMLTTVRAIVREGKIQLLESVNLPEGSELLVTIISEDENIFWANASLSSLQQIWDHPDEDVYGELLEK